MNSMRYNVCIASPEHNIDINLFDTIHRLITLRNSTVDTDLIFLVVPYHTTTEVYVQSILGVNVDNAVPMYCINVDSAMSMSACLPDIEAYKTAQCVALIAQSTQIDNTKLSLLTSVLNTTALRTSVEVAQSIPIEKIAAAIGLWESCSPLVVICTDLLRHDSILDAQYAEDIVYAYTSLDSEMILRVDVDSENTFLSTDIASNLTLSASVETISGVYRKLVEMDVFALTEFDTMTLDNVDWIISE